MRVLALTHVFPRAADDPSAPFLLTWAQALGDQGARVGVVAPHDAGLPAAHDVAGVGVRLARYAPERWERLAYRGEMHQIAATPVGPPLVASLLASLARTVRRQVRTGAPDVVHVHWWIPGAIALRLARVDVPTVLTVHGTDVALLESRPRLAALARWAMGSVDRVEAVSRDLAERLERATGRTADAINPMPVRRERLARAPRPEPGGSDSVPALAALADRSTDPAGRVRLLAVGRMVPEKGFADLVRAAARLPMPATVTIVGTGPERDALTALATACGVDLTLPGRVPPASLHAAYAAADVVVQASHREGLGLVAAEAVCAGTPVVATDSGGVRDLLGPDDLVPVGDPEALAAALVRVIEDPVGAQAASRAAADRVRALLSPEAAAARTLDGYRSLLAGT